MEDVDRHTIEAFLSRPETYGLPAGTPVERIDTHISTLFLAGQRAYKLKKPVDFGYLDFTTLEKRHQACEHEVMLNQRTAPDLYLGCVPVCSVESDLVLGGDAAQAVDWLVEMRRFDQDMLFAHLAEKRVLKEDMIADLATQVALFHGRAEQRLLDGGAARFTRVLDSNLENFAPYGDTVYSDRSIAALDAAMRQELEAGAALLDQRKGAGWVRHCHGDLHLGNVALIEGKPTPFDCIEFNDDFARVDVLYDLAFLMMDLTFRARGNTSLRGFPAAALNAYLTALPVETIEETLEGLALMPLFMACRAAVRSHVAARATEGADPAQREGLVAQAQAYFDFAMSVLEKPKPALWAVGGLSGTGKTRLSHDLSGYLAEGRGAVHLRTDVIRKRLAGVPLTERLPASAYTREASDAIYRKLNDLTRTALAAGQTVICDGVFAVESERQAVEAIGRAAGVEVHGIWLTADLEELQGRVARRAESGTDASDATASVVRAQTDYDLGNLTWTRIDASRSISETLHQVLSLPSVTGP